MITNDKQAYRMEEINDFERDILRFISPDLRNAIKRMSAKDLMGTEEIRFRVNKPVMIQNHMGSFFLETSGELKTKPENPVFASQEQIVKTLELISENSIYAFQDEIRNGYITLRGGHRVGITGKAVLDGTGIKNLKDISGLNIRVSREVRGCSSEILKYIVQGENEIYNTLIISPPKCGKTTILRDIARSISDGVAQIGLKGLKVGIVDERSEIAACFKGSPQKQVGVRTDVLDACPKQLGMSMLLRSMSPDVIITDEIGSSGDKEALMQVINAGVKIVTTAHGYSISQLKLRKEVLSMLEEKVFDRLVVLSSKNGPGTLEEVIDGISMKFLYRREKLCC
ncbi:stage III sporulation protein AA [Acetivibrio clariflavus]|uniref:Stage III sporulation protein AA n=1 Tax=Acetivibrio clariflavus (strain DSM 19732 / NBRC 101661 / EBR45) TaxID=720554 RepID=G8LWK4_ACECE|nr:stage III sporulation protein AA [Acetivibrio clariflavus]AEV68672.1 stage III sporulation protein AA [Acetivibrio clariflavus DSM 19732]